MRFYLLALFAMICSGISLSVVILFAIQKAQGDHSPRNRWSLWLSGSCFVGYLGYLFSLILDYKIQQFFENYIVILE